MDIELTVKDKVVVVTGASSGIGASTVKQLAAQGAKVVFGARRLEKLQEVATNLPQNRIAYQTVDVTDRQQVQSLIDLAVKTFGRVDVLVNNAGLMPIAALAEDHYEEWQRMLDVNVMGVLNGISAVLPVMHRQGSGQILATDSLAGYNVYPNFAVYSGTKFAVRAILEGLRQEEHANHIRTTIIAPGAVKTELYKTTQDPAVAQALVAGWNRDEGSALLPEDIASAIVYAIDAPERASVSEMTVRPANR